MRISVSLPYPDADDEAADPAGMVALARATEAAGLHAVAATDHPFPYTEPGRAGHQALDPFVLLGHLAAVTERVRLHFNLIVTPYRNPFLAARMIATLDHLSHGRVIAAVGAGYMRQEFDALGAPFKGRGARLEHDVAAMRAAWSGEPVVLRGDGYAAAGNVMWPVPAPGRPPLWRGGNTRKAIDSAVAAFDGWAPFEATEATSQQTTTDVMSLDALPAKLAMVREAVALAGRTTPLDVCLVRPRAKWLQDPSRAADDLHRLAEMGVTWVTTHVYGHSTERRVQSVHELAEVVSAAGLATA